jgi:hypothetical protein
MGAGLAGGVTYEGSTSIRNAVIVCSGVLEVLPCLFTLCSLQTLVIHRTFLSLHVYASRFLLMTDLGGMLCVASELSA